MGRKLDILLMRTSRQISKLKSLLSLTVSRIVILRNHRQVRCKQARGDVAQILQLGQLDRALLRGEQVIKEQNMLDAFVMLESYCHLIIERASLLEHAKECPEELREAVAGLIFAASRCGDLPELQSIRAIFTSKFGKEFTSACTELRNHCGVCPKMIQKMSTRSPNLEIKQKIVKEIAAEKGIKLELDEPSNEIAEEKLSLSNNSEKQDVLVAEHDENPSTKAHNQYRNAETAALAAFESAAFAAAAAKAAVELSRAESQGKGSDDKKSTSTQKSSELEESKQVGDDSAGSKVLGKSIYHEEDDNSESEEEETSIEDYTELLHKSRFMEEVKPERSSSSGSGSIKLASEKNHISQAEPKLGGGEEVISDESDTEIQSFAAKKKNIFAVSNQNLNFRRKYKQLDSTFHEDSSKNHQMSYMKLQPPYRKESKLANAEDHIRISVQEDLEKKGFEAKAKDDPEMSDSETRTRSQKHYLNAKKLDFRTSTKGVSMRTRRGLRLSEDSSSP